MKKVIALALVCGFALAFMACGGSKTESTTDTMSADTTKMDTTMMDTTKTDTTKSGS